MLLACGVSALALTPALAKSSAPSPAPAKPDFVSSAASEQTLTLYLDGAVVEETRAIACKAGDNVVELQSIPAQYQPQTLMLESYKGPANGDFQLDTVTHQAPNMNAAGALTKSIGQTVTVVEAGPNGATTKVTGKLQSVSSGQLMIEEADGTHIIYSTQDVKVGKAATNGMSANASLSLNVNCSAPGTYKIKILFQARGWDWHPTDSVVYDPKTKTITTFDASVAITNSSGAAYNQVDVNLIPGGLAGQSYGGRAVPAAAPQFKTNADAGPGGAAVENVGEQKMYTAPTKLTIAPGQSQQVRLFHSSNVPVIPEYIFDASSGYGTTTKAGLVLNTVNDAAHNLGKPLPSGDLRIYVADSSGALKLMPTSRDNATLPEVSTGQDFCINMGATSDIKGESAINAVDQKDPTNQNQILSRTETFTVTLHNYKDTDTQVTVNSGRSSTGTTVVSNAGDATLVNKDGNWVAHVNVPKGGETTVTFSVKTVYATNN
jgi:hypothetical protein